MQAAQVPLHATQPSTPQGPQNRHMQQPSSLVLPGRAQAGQVPQLTHPGPQLETCAVFYTCTC
eukprot:1158124-Pelagomonas_calceolata.AAC.1